MRRTSLGNLSKNSFSNNSGESWVLPILSCVPAIQSGTDLQVKCGRAARPSPSKHARSGQCWPSVGRVGKTSANLPTLCQCCQCFANIFANAVIIVVVSFLEFFHDCVMILGHFLLLIAFQFAKNTFFLLRFSQRW